MPSEHSSDVNFEIGHVLFIDIVGYSKLLINEQSEQIEKLREIVRGTEQFQAAQAEGKLLRLPTGDGGALVFRNSLEAPAKCASEISQALKHHPELRVRMGIHSGPVNKIIDLNERANIAGAGVNIAQRVMDCGDPDLDCARPLERSTATQKAISLPFSQQPSLIPTICEVVASTTLCLKSHANVTLKRDLKERAYFGIDSASDGTSHVQLNRKGKSLCLT